MSTGADVIHKAETQKGVTEHPPGSNTGKEVLAYQRATWLGGTGWPWCVAYVQWVFREVGVPLPNLGAGAWALLDWAKSVGWDVPQSKVQAGDVVILATGAGHACLFIRFEGNSVRTIDGNWQDKVGEQLHPTADVKGYFRNKHLDHPTPVKVKRPKVFQIVTSHSGHKKVVFMARRKKGVIKWLMSHPLKKIQNGITIRRRRKHA